MLLRSVSELALCIFQKMANIGISERKTLFAYVYVYVFTRTKHTCFPEPHPPTLRRPPITRNER